MGNALNSMRVGEGNSTHIQCLDKQECVFEWQYHEFIIIDTVKWYFVVCTLIIYTVVVRSCNAYDYIWHQHKQLLVAYFIFCSHSECSCIVSVKCWTIYNECVCVCERDIGSQCLVYCGGGELCTVCVCVIWRPCVLGNSHCNGSHVTYLDHNP